MWILELESLLVFDNYTKQRFHLRQLKYQTRRPETFSLDDIDQIIYYKC